MSLHRHIYPNGISFARSDYMRLPNTARNYNAFNSRHCSSRNFYVDWNKVAYQQDQYTHKWGTDVTKHTTECSRQYQHPRYSVPCNMNRCAIPLQDRTRSYPRSNHVTRPVPQRHHGFLDRIHGSLDTEFEERCPKARRELRETFKDSNELRRRSPKLKRSRSEAIKYCNRNAEFHCQKDTRYSNRNSPTSKSSAHVANPRSKMMLNNEKLRKKSPSRVQGGKKAGEGRIFGFLFFKGNIGRAETKDRKDVRRDRDVAKEKKEVRQKLSKRTVRENKMNYERKAEENRTRHHSASRKSMNSRRDHQDRAKRAHGKGSESKEGKTRTGASSRDMKTICEFQIPEEKGSGLVVKIRGKR